MTDKKSKDILRGTTLDIYRLLLTTDKVLGIREIQRTLNLSSPSQAQYHLNKLEEAGLLKRKLGNYVINKVFLENCVKIRRFIIPRYLFYSVFASFILFIELLFFRPPFLTREYFFSTVSILLFAVIFWYETVKVWIKGSL